MAVWSTGDVPVSRWRRSDGVGIRAISTRIGLFVQTTKRPLAKVPSPDTFRLIALHLVSIIMLGNTRAWVQFLVVRNLLEQ